jgi:hypothetical protein
LFRYTLLAALLTAGLTISSNLSSKSGPLALTAKPKPGCTIKTWIMHYDAEYSEFCYIMTCDNGIYGACVTN